jgi:uncharacterized protein YbaR (Trm112 family)
MDGNEIIACPKCRSAALPYHDSEQGYFVCCTKSDKITDSAYPTQQEAITAWNNEIIAMRKVKGAD